MLDQNHYYLYIVTQYEGRTLGTHRVVSSIHTLHVCFTNIYWTGLLFIVLGQNRTTKKTRAPCDLNLHQIIRDSWSSRTTRHDVLWSVESIWSGLIERNAHLPFSHPSTKAYFYISPSLKSWVRLIFTNRLPVNTSTQISSLPLTSSIQHDNSPLTPLARYNVNNDHSTPSHSFLV